MRMILLYYKCTFALFIFRLHKLGIEAHAYAHYTSLLLLCFALLSPAYRLVRRARYPACSTPTPYKADYGNATLYWAASVSVSPTAVQSVLNAAARLIYRRRRFDHVTSLLRELHWLKSSERVAYKLAVTYSTGAFMAWHRVTSLRASVV